LSTLQTLLLEFFNQQSTLGFPVSTCHQYHLKVTILYNIPYTAQVVYIIYGNENHGTVSVPPNLHCTLPYFLILAQAWWEVQTQTILAAPFYNTLHLPSSNSQPQLLYQQSLLMSLAYGIYTIVLIYMYSVHVMTGGLGGPNFVLCLFFALGVELYFSGAKKRSNECATVIQLGCTYLCAF
jgi:hypothetical protein